MTEKQENAQVAPLLLLVDDTRVTADIDKAFFVEAGFRVLVATTLREILDIVAQNQVNLIMIDAAFGKWQGVVVAEQARKASANNAVNLLITSVVDTIELRKAAEKAGASGFLLKPAPRQKVLKEVKALTSLVARDSERVPEHLNVKMSWGSHNDVGAWSLDVSEDGIHLASNNSSPEVGSLLNLNIAMGENGAVVSVDGTVVRHTKEGFGVRFSELSRNAKRALDKFLLAHSIESRATKYYL